MSPILELFIKLLPVILELFDCPETSSEGLLRAAREPGNPARQWVERVRAKDLAQEAGQRRWRWRRFLDQSQAEVAAELRSTKAEAMMEAACNECGIGGV